MLHRHHIIPRHMGGSNSPSNLIVLTVAEHAEAHRVLFMEYGKHADWVAWMMLSGQIGKEELQLERSRIGGLNSAKAWTPERRRQQAIRVSKLRPENKGRKLNLSQEERNARSNRKANLGRISITHPELHLNKLIAPDSLGMWKADGWVEGLYRKTKPIGRPANGTSHAAACRHRLKLGIHLRRPGGGRKKVTPQIIADKGVVFCHST